MLQQFVGALPSSDVLLTLPVKSGSVSISSGHHDLLLFSGLVPDNHNFPVGCLSANGPADFPKIIGEAANSARVAMSSMEVRT